MKFTWKDGFKYKTTIRRPRLMDSSIAVHDGATLVYEGPRQYWNEFLRNCVDYASYKAYNQEMNNGQYGQLTVPQVQEYVGKV